MKLSFKRIMAYVLTFVMVLGMLPMVDSHVHAATSLTTSVTGLTASWDYNSTNKNGNYTASSNTITGTATGGMLNTTTIVLTLTNNLGEEATLKFDYSKNGGTATGAISAISGTYENVLANGASITISFKSDRNQTNTLSITNISLISTSAADPTITFKPGANGTYTVNGTGVTADTEMTVAAGTELALVATAASGYQFFGWQKADGNYLSQNASFTLTAAEDTTVTPVFISNSVALFGVGSAKYDDLTEAGAAAAAGTNKTIILLNNGTVSGSHTIPAGTTLLIPYDDANTAYGASASCTSYTSLFNDSGHIAWVQPSAYRTLTLAADANITVNGNIEVGGRHAAAGGKLGMYGGSPTDKLGYINMLSGSHIDLNSGANLYCWGYIYGNGTITAKNGAAIYENFQIMDFRGGSVTSALAADYLVFPLSQYYVQNVEVATKYEYGSTEYIATSIFMSNQCYGATVKFIGSGAMFQPEEGSYLVKDYDPTTDRLKLDVYGNCALASMNLELGGTGIDSSSFVLPITNNMQIALHSGTTTLKQNMMMLPGSSLTIDQGATLNLAYTDVVGDVVTAGGYVLQIFDSDNWTWGYHAGVPGEDPAFSSGTFEKVTGLNFVHPSLQFRPIQYTATTRKTRTTADLTDVTIDINGTVITDGFMYTTVTWNDFDNEDYSVAGGGANVISSGKTGVVAMNNGAGLDMLGVMYDQAKAAYYYIPLASVQLKNGDGTLVDTTTAEPGTTYKYCATHDCWYTGECAACAVPTHVEVTWIVNGGDSTQEVAYNTVPVYNEGVAPTKGSDATYHYTFAGWATTADGTVLTELPAATESAIYHAIFTPTAHSGSDDGDCTTAVTCSCGYVIIEAKEHNHVAGKCTACGDTLVVTLPGSFNDWNGYNMTWTEDGIYTYTVHLNAGTYQFKIVDNGIWHGNNGTFEDTTTTTSDIGWEMTTDGGDCTLTASGGTYTFKYNIDTNMLIVTAELDHVHSYGEPTFVWGDYNTCTATAFCADCPSNAIITSNTVSYELVDGKVIATATITVNGTERTDKKELVAGPNVIYYTNPNQWTTVSAYFFNNNGFVGAGWAGTGMTKVSDGLWFIEIPEGADYVIFNNGTEQTSNLPLPTDEANIYFDASGSADAIWGYAHFCAAHLTETAGRDATCTADGWNAYYTCACGKLYSDAAATAEITDLDAWKNGDGKIEKLGHGHTEGFDYTDLKNGNHKVTCKDCNAITVESEAHKYDETTHTCACEDVEKFTLTVEIPTGALVELTVPYGANLLGILDQAAAENKIPAKDDKIRVNNEWANGEYYVDGFFCFTADSVFVEETSTMPAENVSILQLFYTYGWTCVDTDGDYEVDSWQYTDPEKDLLPEGWHFIEEDYDDVEDGAWYYFEHKGYSDVRVEGISRVPYNTELGYKPDQETLDYCANKGIEFIDAAEAWFVFDESGKFQTAANGLITDNRWAVNGMLAWHPGLVEVEGEYYYFIGDVENGGNIMVTGDNCNVTKTNGIVINGVELVNGLYTLDAEGKLCLYDGIQAVGGTLYYYEGYHKAIGAGLIQVGDNYYYVVSDASLVVDAEYWVSVTNGYEIVVGNYQFDENGVLLNPVDATKNGIVDGYYYVNGKPTYAGLIEIDGEIYYVRSNGQLATDKYWITRTNDMEGFTQGYYQFDENGVLQGQKNGIVAEDGTLYYYVDGVKGYGAGVIEIGGSYYYVKSNGEVVNNRSYWITNVGDTGVVAKEYTFGENGTFTPEFTVDLKNGIVDGYYYVNGSIAYGAGLIKLEDGSYIYVRSNGQLATNEYWTTNHNGVLPEGLYDFGDSGILVIE